MSDPIWVATASEDGIAKIWYCQEKEQEKDDKEKIKVQVEANLAGPAGHTGGITSISWCPAQTNDGEDSDDEDQGDIKSQERMLLTSSKDTTCRVWRLKWEEAKKEKELTGAPLSFSSGSKLTWSYRNFREKQTIQEDGRTKEVTVRHNDYVTAASWRTKGQEKGRQILSWSDDFSAKLWDATNAVDTSRGRYTEDVVEFKATLKAEAGHSKEVAMASWSPDGNKVVTCGNDSVCMIWSAKNGHHLKMLPPQASKDGKNQHAGPIWSVKYAYDGREVVTASRDGTARVWDSNTGQHMYCLCDPTLGGHVSHKEAVFGAVWNPHTPGEILTCSLDGTAKVWDTRDYNRPAIVIDKHEAAVWTAVFGNCKGGQILTCSHDMTAIVFDQRLLRPTHWLRGHTGILWQASFSHDDKWVVTCSEDRTARVWRIEGGTKDSQRSAPYGRLIDPMHPTKHAVTCAAMWPPPDE